MTIFNSDSYSAWADERQALLADVLGEQRVLRDAWEEDKTQLVIRRDRLLMELHEGLNRAFPNHTGDERKMVGFLALWYGSEPLEVLTGVIDDMIQRQVLIEQERDQLPSREALEASCKLSKAFIRGEEQTIMRESLSSIRSGCDEMRAHELASDFRPEEPLSRIREAGFWRTLVSPTMKRKQTLVARADAIWERGKRFHKQEGLPDTINQLQAMVADRRSAAKAISRSINEEFTKLRAHEDQLANRIRLDKLHAKVSPRAIQKTLVEGLAHAMNDDSSLYVSVLNDIGWSVDDRRLSETVDAMGQLAAKTTKLKRDMDAVDAVNEALKAFSRLLRQTLALIPSWRTETGEFDRHLVAMANQWGAYHQQLPDVALDRDRVMTEYDIETQMEALVEALFERLEIGDMSKVVSRRLTSLRGERRDDSTMTLGQFTSMASSCLGWSVGASPSSSGGVSGTCGTSASAPSVSSPTSGGDSGGCM